MIGNAEYKNIEKLTNTVNDAQDIAAALKGMGFEVDLRLNVGETQFGAAIDSYVAKLAGDSNSEGFFWYAGHGVQIRDQNYLLPVDASIESERSLQRNAFSLDELLADLEGARNKVNVVILDACRNNPLPSSARGAGGTRGLALIQDVPSDLFVMFSTDAGNVADDGKGKRNSPFAEAFLKHIASPEPVAIMASDVINETLRLTANQQRPFSRGSIISDKYYSINPDRSGAAMAVAEDRGETFFKEGVTLFNNGVYDRAIVYFSEAIRNKMESAEVYNYRGEAHLLKDDYDKAIADFTEAIGLGHTNAYTTRGTAYLRKGNYDRAIADFTEAIRLDSGFALAYVLRGRAYSNKGDYDKAIADYTEAVRLNPQYAVAYNGRGIAYHNKGDYDRAIADFTEAVRLDPNYTQAKNNLEIAQKRGK
ncbi:MAG: tetratricopeptide repeat protein [Treponema sp.]|nr:tetratricopeptide repeat protein [Treponema sp.]